MEDITLTQVLSWLWDITKVFIFPVCLYLFQRQVKQMDDRREHEYTERKKVLDEQQKQTTDIQFLMMQRMDKLSELCHLMAQKLHDKGVINGDLEALDKKYKELDAEYEKEVKRLALAYSKR